MISHSHPATHASTTLWYCSSPAPRSLHQLEQQDLPKGRHPREHSPVVPLWARLALLCLLSGPISCAYFSHHRNSSVPHLGGKPHILIFLKKVCLVLVKIYFFIGHYKKLLLILNMDLNIRSHFPMYFFCKIASYFSISLFLLFPKTEC